ncbi:SPOR domain-containing protein [Nocardia sp. NPDC057440]|uniref:SPOR domain-containing protein n=1 Tax=Nocardia sp. NPDC057440 TaxID=3346134 RepID=UPI0036702E3D
MVSVFLLEHVYRTGDDIDERKRVGIYASKEDAQNAIDRLRVQPGFSDYPDCFVIQGYEIDRDYWTEGYDDSDEVQ